MTSTKKTSFKAPLAISATALALAGASVALPASAQPGGGNGGGKGGSNAKEQGASGQKAAPGGSSQKASGAGQNAGGNAAKGAGARQVQAPAARTASKAPAQASQKQQHTPAMQSPVREQKAVKAEAPVKASTKASTKASAKVSTGPAKASEGRWVSDRDTPAKASAAVQHEQRADVKRVSYTGPKGKSIVVPTNDRVRVITRERAIDWSTFDRRRTYDGCPPGLAKKYNGCMPPGLASPPTRAWVQPTWYWHDYDRDYRYRYSDGYMLRLSASNAVLGYIPLLGGALAIGEVWPGSYQSVVLPSYYTTYYDLGPANSYRYYGDTIYRVDPDTAAIRTVVALLTGNDIVVGQAMPMGYEVYNVPYGYRDQYYDTPDALYRYSDGYIYQLDPTTRLVQAAIELLA